MNNDEEVFYLSTFFPHPAIPHSPALRRNPHAGEHKLIFSCFQEDNNPFPLLKPDDNG
ncbi:MAG: hypothetical protein U9N60_04540 [Thermodesulfobacteriota bacterium]|nr:hypothetical protein [Thermodesulfobacteriota bacterium]